VAWSKAAVKTVADRPSIDPSYRFSMRDTPTGRAVEIAGSGVTGVGTKLRTRNVPDARTRGS
jgi:hypothetical protein